MPSELHSSDNRPAASPRRPSTQAAVPPAAWRCEVLPPGSGLGGFRADWQRLNLRLFGGHPLLDADYVDGLLRHFDQQSVVLAQALQDEEAIAMLLLVPTRPRLGVWSSYLPAQAQIGPTLVPTDLDLQGLFAALPGYATELDLLCNDPRYGDLRQLPRRSMQALAHALTMSVALKGSFDDYWAQRPRKLIQNMRRYMRRLQTEGGGERLDIISAPDAVAAAVERYAALESRGWKGREGTAVRAGTPQGHFYAEVMREFASRGEALVYELWLGDDLLASRMLLLRGSVAVMLKTSFDERFERYAPGRTLLLRTLEDLFARAPGGVAEFYTDAAADLLAWSDAQRWINHVSIYRHRSLPQMFSLLRKGKQVWQASTARPNVDTQVMLERSGATVERFESPRQLPDDAASLLRQRELTYVEFGVDWFALLTDTVFRDGAQAVFYVLRRHNQVLAVLPVGVRQNGRCQEVDALVNFYTTLYAPALQDGLGAEDLLPLTMALRREYRSPAYRFWPMDPASREFDLLRSALRLAGLRPYEYFAFGNWFLQVEGDWAHYQKGRSGQLRSTIKRMTKRLAAETDGRLEIICSEADVERGIAAYDAVYSASWKVAEPYPQFIPELIRLCARRGWLRLGLAWVGDKPIAAQLWIVNAGRAHIYKVAYDEAYKALTPGTLVTALLMEEVIERDRVAEVDYLMGDDNYKKVWMSHRRERFGLVAYDPTTPRGLLGLARQALGQAWRRLRAPSTAAVPAENHTS